MIARFYTYHWMHIPTGERGERTEEFRSLAELDFKLNFWNQLNPGVWQYSLDRIDEIIDPREIRDDDRSPLRSGV